MTTEIKHMYRLLDFTELSKSVDRCDTLQKEALTLKGLLEEYQYLHYMVSQNESSGASVTLTMGNVEQEYMGPKPKIILYGDDMRSLFSTRLEKVSGDIVTIWTKFPELKSVGGASNA